MSKSKYAKELETDRERMWQILLTSLDPSLTERDKSALKSTFESFCKNNILTVQNAMATCIFDLREEF